MNHYSIIIPTFNSEQYIRRCIDAILEQEEISSYEIIIVDDCSTDSTQSIIKDYADSDSRIKYKFLDMNSGPGVARNIGLSMVSFENVLFCDSDDFFKKNMLSRLDNILNQHPDIDMIHFRGMVNRETYLLSRYECRPYKLYNKDVILSGKEHIFNRKDGIIGAIYYTLYKNQFLKDIGVQFIPTTHLEDSLFILQCFYEAKKIYFTDDQLYNRTYRENSLMTTGQTKKRIEELMLAIKCTYEYMLTHEDVSFLFSRFVNWAIVNIKPYYDIDYAIRKLKELRLLYGDYLKTDMFGGSIDELESKKMGYYGLSGRNDSGIVYKQRKI